jgi:hypothetical protein
MHLSRLARRAVLVAIAAATVAVEPHAAGTAFGQATPQVICGSSGGLPRPIGAPNADGWTSREESLANADERRRYRFSVKEKGTAYVYVGDQWYDLNLGLYSLKSGADVGCWQVRVASARLRPPGRARHRGRARRLHPDGAGRRQRRGGSGAQLHRESRRRPPGLCARARQHA